MCYLARSDILKGPAEKSMSGASGRQRVDIASFADVRVPAPRLSIQRKIAAILSAYDDLIENCLRRIEILEEMTRNLYREWFVRFRFPGHESARFVGSPLGRIPEGWRVGKLGDVLELKYGRGLKKADRQLGTVPVYGSSGVVGRHNEALVAGPGVIVGRKGNVGSVFLSFADFWPIDTVYYVRSAELPLRFLYFDLQEQNFINSDAAVPGLSRQQALAMEMASPPARVAEEFCSLVEPFLAQSESLAQRNAALRQARDLLLPRLISGELDVSDLPVQMPPLYRGDLQCIAGYRFFREITALPFVTRVVLFGSRARGDHEERSDIDLCVFCPEQTTEEEWMQVLACLERDCVDTLRRVDCVRFETGDAALRENVLTEGVVLYEGSESP